MSRVTIIGDGGWGTALALVLRSGGHQVTIWGPFADTTAAIAASGQNEKYLPGVALPPDIAWTSDRSEAVREAEAVVLAVPSRWFIDVVGSFSGRLPRDLPVLSVTKGLDRESGRRMTEVARDLLGREPVAALSGPSHAEEVARGVPTAVVIGCARHDLACFWQSLFNQRAFRVYTTGDTAGVEWGGALKNVVALAAGISDGIGYGDNAKAALITRGLAEITRLGRMQGAQPATFAGLSGMGDLVVTCVSRHSRNRSVGERLGRGETVQAILDGMQQVAEGVWTCAGAFDLARRIGIEAPITSEVHAVLYEGKSPRKAVEDLLARDPRPEDD